MIGPTGAVRVLVATKPVDFRKGAEGLAALVRETMKSDPFSGAVYVFRAKRADRVSEQRRVLILNTPALRNAMQTDVRLPTGTY